MATTPVGTKAVLQFLKATQAQGRVKVVGIDVTAELEAAVKSGELDGLVLLKAMEMGYEGVLAAMAVLEGKKVAKTIDTGVAIMMLENANAAEIQEIVHPDLARWNAR